MTIEETIAIAVEAKLRTVIREELRAILLETQTQPQTSASPFLTVEQVAERCGKVTAETVRGWIHRAEGGLAARKVGARYLVSPADLDRFLAHETVEKPGAVDSDAHLAAVVERMNRAGSQ